MTPLGLATRPYVWGKDSVVLQEHARISTEANRSFKNISRTECVDTSPASHHLQQKPSSSVTQDDKPDQSCKSAQIRWRFFSCVSAGIATCHRTAGVLSCWCHSGFRRVFPHTRLVGAPCFVPAERSFKRLFGCKGTAATADATLGLLDPCLAQWLAGNECLLQSQLRTCHALLQAFACRAVLLVGQQGLALAGYIICGCISR